MRRKVILAVTLSAVLAYGVVYVWTFGFFPGKDLKRTQALRTLVAQNVRIGDSPELVIRFLDAQHLDHSTLMKPEYMLISGHDYSKQHSSGKEPSESDENSSRPDSPSASI